MNKDRELIVYIRDHPLANADQLARLTGRPMQSVARALKRLLGEERPYINRNKNREVINTNYVYAITPYAAKDKEIGGHPIDLSERKDKGLPHEEFITDIHIDLKDLVVYWRQDRKTLWRHSVQPDAFFKLRQGEVTRSYFLEAELGTNNLCDVLAKYKSYVTLLEKLPQVLEKNDWLPLKKSFSVLTVCKRGQEHAQALACAIQESKIVSANFKRAYLFSYPPVSHCYLPYDSGRYRIMEV